MTKRWVGITAATLITLILCVTGCGSDPQQDYSSVRARLDQQGGQIIFPLEAYAMSSVEVRDVSHANALLISDCMAEGGRDFPRAMQDWDAIPALPERRYGLWSRSDAESNGYELPKSAEEDKVFSQEEEKDEGWWDAFSSCQSKVILFPVMGVNFSPQMSPVDQGMRESYDTLLASSEFKKIRGAWTECIIAQGLTPNPESKVMNPEIPAPGIEQLRVAAVDAGCKESVNAVQSLADFEARQQMAYKEKHESELTEYRSQADDVLAAARKVLATRGG